MWLRFINIRVKGPIYAAGVDLLSVALYFIYFFLLHHIPSESVKVACVCFITFQPQDLFTVLRFQGTRDLTLTAALQKLDALQLSLHLHLVPRLGDITGLNNSPGEYINFYVWVLCVESERRFCKRIISICVIASRTNR